MSNLLVAPIEENAAKLKANKKPKPKEGWLDDLITKKAMKSLKLPTKTKKTPIPTSFLTFWPGTR